MVLKKVTYDQLLFAPVFLMVLLSVIGIFQGNELEDLQVKLREEYPEILLNNYKVMSEAEYKFCVISHYSNNSKREIFSQVWPMVQLLNFYFVPLQYQVLIVQSVAVVWNTYISYRTSLNKLTGEVHEISTNL